MAARRKSRATRHQRVKEILDQADGDSPADYGGAGKFWNLPLEQFIQVRIHGIRMIASAVEEESEGNCCCSSEAKHKPTGQAEPMQPPFPGRGARSGLIKGLRGEPPFDGVKFPRLPWGGKPVAEDDIQFISDWIEDGCPESDRVLASLEVSEMQGEPRFEKISAAEEPKQIFRAFSGGAEGFNFLRSELRQRVNLDCMADSQIERLRFAFREMYELDKWPEDRRNYNNQALIHQNHCQHGWERFLPWHRIYLYEFEQVLQDFCPDVSVPYWDWTMPQYRPEKPEKGWIIPQSFQAFLTAESIENLKRLKPALPPDAASKLKAMENKKFVSPRRFFDGVKKLIGAKFVLGQYRKRFIGELLGTNPLWYPLRYPAEYNDNGQETTINEAIHYHYPSAADIDQIQSLKTFRDYGGGSLYNDSFGFLDQNPHNTLHIWTGGMNPDYKAPSKVPKNRNHGVKIAGRRFHTRDDLYSQPPFGDMFSNLTASYDPIFWPIHVNIDRLWWDWQQMNPNALPSGLDGVLTPWTYTVRDTLDIHQFGYEYVKSAFVIPVGLETPVSRFVSQPIDIPEPVQKNFRQAEIRLHRVPQLPRSCFVRVFLNLPDANGKTPLTHANYAGYLAVFGHGPCYGGPGHCDLPPAQRRKFDLRPRSHNTPRNHRINITECAKRLLKKGAKSLQITLVVIGADYQEDKELLRLEGVSLNFLD